MKLKVLGNRVILRERVAEVSSIIHMLEYENSTWEVIASGVGWLKPGDTVIIDRHGGSVSFLDADPTERKHNVIAREDAIIAVVSGDDVKPAPGIILGEPVELKSSLIKLWDKGYGQGELIRTTDGKTYIIRTEDGWYIRWRGKELRAVYESSLLAEVEGLCADVSS